MQPGFTQDGIANGCNVSLAQAFRHVLRVEDQVVPEAKCECKERITEGSKGMAGNGCWTKKLIQIFLSNLVRIFSLFAKVVSQS